jgi:hypothetical protein
MLGGLSLWFGWGCRSLVGNDDSMFGPKCLIICRGLVLGGSLVRVMKGCLWSAGIWDRLSSCDPVLIPLIA